MREQSPPPAPEQATLFREATPAPALHPRAPEEFERALRFALKTHGDQRRKGKGVPYVSHLLQVAGLVLENGGDWEQAMAGLLHDSIEDRGVTDEALRRSFGERVARIVRDCTDTLPGDTPAKKSPWRERKRSYLEHLSEALADSLLVAACDKRQNLSEMIADYRAPDGEVAGRFSATPDEQLLFYREFVRRAAERIPARLRIDLENLLSEFEEIVISRYPVSKPGEA